MSDILAIDFQSATGTGTIHGRLYLPQQITAVNNLLLQIVHGMAEHMERYDLFCRFLAGKGLAVCIHDQAGHGQSASSPETLGFFDESGGVENVQQDIDLMADHVLEMLAALPDSPKTWRRVLLGHSMGSFIGRCYCTRPNNNLAGAIFSGTKGSDPALALGLFLAKRSIRKNGSLYKDNFIASLSSQGNLKRIPDAKTEFDWLTRDQAIVDAYVADPWCGYTFTAAGYRDLFTWIILISHKEWAASIPASLPILLVSGSEDPVGQYGKGPRQVLQRLADAGHRAELKIYDGCRHEVLNEINRQEVWQDILNWLLAMPVQS